MYTTHHSLHALCARGVLVDDLLHQVEQVGVAQHLRRQLPDELGRLHGLGQELKGSNRMGVWTPDGATCVSDILSFTYLGHGVYPLLDLGVRAALLGRVQRQQLREGLPDHGLMENRCGTAGMKCTR